MKNDDLDRFIAGNLEKDELDIPLALQSQVRRRIASLSGPPRRSAWRGVKIWVPWLAAAMLVVLVSLIGLFPPRPALKKISQIRTEFHIPEKNITIVWLQRDDFHWTEKIE